METDKMTDNVTTPSPIVVEPYTGGRKTGYSLRESLTSQGVTCMDAMRAHLNHVHRLLVARPSFDITRYRVNENYPNQHPA
jgi:hypothetical protein